MCELPENLQVIKLEPTSPSAEDKPAHNIKAKLNLHVKRRLQDNNNTPSPDDNEQQQQGNLNQKQQNPSGTTLAEIKISNKTNKEQQRQKRPYHKKADKIKAAGNASVLTAQIESAATAAAAVVGCGPTQPRKYNKTKQKQLLTTGNPETLTPNSQDDTSSHATALNTGTISAGDEDETGHDEMRPGREKEKCPDVLAMVLSMKKRALMQDPEVQHFLSEVMKVMKS